MSPLTSAPPVNASSTACGSRRTDLSATALEKARSCAMYRGRAGHSPRDAWHRVSNARAGAVRRLIRWPGGPS